MSDTNNENATIENLAALLQPWQIDWEPRFRDQVWTPRRRLRRTGL